MSTSEIVALVSVATAVITAVIGRVYQELEGWMANERLEQFLIQNNIHYPQTNYSPTPPENRVFEKKLVLPGNIKK